MSSMRDLQETATYGDRSSKRKATSRALFIAADKRGDVVVHHCVRCLSAKSPCLYMSNFVPLHDRPPYYADIPPGGYTAQLPRYAPPDLDPTVPLPMSDSESDEGYEDYPGQEGFDPQSEAGPSRKRPRHDDEEEHGVHAHHQSQTHNGHDHEQARAPARTRRPDVGIVPSFFGLSARSEFTKSIGEFIMNAAHGKDNVEVSRQRWKAG